MPAKVVVVLDDLEMRRAVVRAIGEARLDVAAYDNAISALSALESDSTARIVVARAYGPVGTLDGVSLLRMLRYKQIKARGTSSLRAVLVGQPRDREHVAGVDGLLVVDPNPWAIAEAVQRLLKSGGSAALRITTGPIIWEGAISVVAPPAQAATRFFNPRTDRLIREAGKAIARSRSVQRWRMPTRRPFDLGVG